MTNPYYTFSPHLIPGSRARSDEINTQYTLIEQAFDNLPSTVDALTTGRATYGVESGSGDTYIVTLIDTRTSNQNGDEVVFRATHGNDGASTIQVDGITAVPLVRYTGNDVQAGDLLSGSWYTARYDSATNRFYIVSPALATLVGSLVYAPPTTLVGLVASEGILPSVLRSDARLAIDPAIAPVWTGIHDFTAPVIFDNDAVFNGTTTFNGAIFGGTIASSTLAPDGTVSAPSISFAADTDTGFYRIGSNHIGLATSGVLRLDVSTTAITPALPVQGAAGTAGSPTYSFTGDPDGGMYSAGVNTIGFSTNGTARLTISTTSISPLLQTLAPAGTAAAPSYSITGSAGTGMYSSGADILAFAVAGVKRLDFTATAATWAILQEGAPGTAAGPGYAFNTDINSGMYSVASDDLGFATGGVLRLDISTTQVTSTLVFRGPAGGVSAPTYSFSGDTDTGMYSGGAGVLNFSTNGVQRLSISATGVATFAGQIVGSGGLAITGAATVGGQTIAVLASPAFTGNPTAPTQASGNNSTRLATTAFVQDAVTTTIPDQLSTASGSAPSYSLRAAGVYNGVSNVLLRGSNIASVIKTGVGRYTVSFTTAMPNANYTVTFGVMRPAGNAACWAHISDGTTPSVNSFQVTVTATNSGPCFDQDTARLSFDVQA